MDKSAPENAFKLGVKYEQTYRGCGQCIIAAVQDTLGLEDHGICQSATGFAGGLAIAGDSGCGAYVGAIALLGSIVGRPKSTMKDPDRIRFQTYKIARKLHDKFVEEYGTVNCNGIQTKLMGRPYYLADPDEMEKFHNAGGHDEVCPAVVGNAAKWLTELILEENLIPEK